MKTIMKIAKGTGKVILALLTGVLMPILIWVALGVALNKKLAEKKVKEATAPTIGEILNKAKVDINQ
ncbi:MAG: hypothetical protein A2144_13115 [Chloroflexi bacterium RBG_16_50_9]|nr:MAG: hypothetical protein A2144_13115 [Chloroflexi bacterium RBG_16_50_9]